MLSERAGGTYKDVRELIPMVTFTDIADKNIGAKIREYRATVLKEGATWPGDLVFVF